VGFILREGWTHVCGCDCESVNLDNDIAEEIRCDPAGEMAALNAFYVCSARLKTLGDVTSQSFRHNNESFIIRHC
jgi:hypothetical protein